MPRFVRDDGRKSARLVVIGEAPGAHEDSAGVPFVGPAGYKLSQWWREVLLSRSDFYLTNVYPYQPPRNDIKAITPGELAPWIDALHDRLAQLDDPWLIVPTGNTALRVLTGLPGITRRRGSIYLYRDKRGRRIKVIPTIHPAAIFRQPSWERRCRHDWRRIASDAQFRETRLPTREHFIRPTLTDVWGFVEDVRKRADALAIDIETPRKLVLTQHVSKRGKVAYRRSKGDRRITCVGFAYESGFSMTIPTTLEYWQTDAALEEAWDAIRMLCAAPCEKVLQNGLFDAWWLAQHNVLLHNWRWDTRWLSHARDPLDAHSLDYQASIYTREPYWKDDTKEKNEDDADVGAKDVDTFWRYNGKDAAVTRELLDVHLTVGADRIGYYERQYAALFPALLDMSLRGMRMDDATRKRELARFMVEAVGIQDKLTIMAGGPLYGSKGSLSFKRLAEYLYDHLRLPRQTNRATGRVSTNELSVRRLMLRYPSVLGKWDAPADADKPGPLILRHRRLEALQRFAKDTIADADGYARSQFGWTDTMRLRSGKNPRGSGNNSQNTDRDLLHLYVPDPGHIFLECDLSQAEDRVVKMLTRSPRLIERARALPWENDEHVLAASLIFNVPQSAVTRKPGGGQRYLGKRARHAGNYGMRGRTLSEQLLKEGIVIDPDEGDRMINTILDKDTPEVRDWQCETRQQVLRHKMLGNSWGLVWDLSFERPNDELFRSCYALIPQSEVVQLMNQWGLVPLWQWLSDRQSPARIVNQRHDSLIISTPPQDAWAIACFLKSNLERPRVYSGNELIIWCEMKLGHNAECSIAEFKKFPSKDEFTDAVDRAYRATLQREGNSRTEHGLPYLARSA